MQRKILKVKNRFENINVLKLGVDNFLIIPNNDQTISGSLKETLTNLYKLGIDEKEIVLGFEKILDRSAFKIAFTQYGTFLGAE